MKAKHLQSLAVGVAVALLAVVPLMFPGLRSLLTVAIAKGIVVLGVMVLLRAGQVSLGHGMFVAVSAYTVALLARAYRGGDVAFLLPAALVVTGIIGFLLGLFVARYRYLFFSMLTLAISMVTYSILAKFYNITGGTDGVSVPTPVMFGVVLSRSSFEWTLYYVAIVVAAVAAGLIHRYLQSPLGQALDAMRTNELRLEYLGVSAQRVFLIAFTVSTLLAATGGSLLALTVGHVAAEMSLWVRSAELLFIAILGGSTSVVNPFAGALVYELVRAYAAAVVVEGWQAVLGIVLILLVLFAPGGLGEVYSRLLGWLVPGATEQEEANAVPSRASLPQPSPKGRELS